MKNTALTVLVAVTALAALMLLLQRFNLAAFIRHLHGA